MLDLMQAVKASMGLRVKETDSELIGKELAKKVYGFHVDPTISSPDDAVTYLADAVGKTPAAMGVSSFSYGDWADAFFMPRPCMLRYDGTVAYYLDPNDYTKKADGTPSDVGNASFEGNAMMEWGLIWYKFETPQINDLKFSLYPGLSFVALSEFVYLEAGTYKVWQNAVGSGDFGVMVLQREDLSGGIFEQSDGLYHIETAGKYAIQVNKNDQSKTYTDEELLALQNNSGIYVPGEGTFYCSDRQVDESYHCWCNTNAKNETSRHFYTAIYNGTVINGKMRSLSGLALGSSGGTDKTGVQERSAALANNVNPDKDTYPEWYTCVWSDYTLITALAVLLGKSLDVQHVFGLGITKNDSSSNTTGTYVTGTANTGGLFTGSTTDSTVPVKVFGMENWWGCNWRRTVGLSSSTVLAYKLTYGTADGTTVAGYEPNSSGVYIGGYKGVYAGGKTVAARDIGSGYIKKMHFGEHGFVPIDVDGAKDQYWSAAGNAGNMATAAVGGDNNPESGNNAGIAVSISNSFGAHYEYLGTALSCKPINR